MLVLSVLEDPDGGECQLPGRRKKFPQRLNGHVGTEGVYGFTYGFAAARIRTQSARGQHAAFWMQAVGGQQTGGPKAGGAEIDIMEYFGDDHPEGGLTSFTYFLDEDGKKQTEGGWLPDVEELGDDWAERVPRLLRRVDARRVRLPHRRPGHPAHRGRDVGPRGVPDPEPALLGLRAAALQRRAAGAAWRSTGRGCGRPGPPQG